MRFSFAYSLGYDASSYGFRLTFNPTFTTQSTWQQVDWVFLPSNQKKTRISHGPNGPWLCCYQLPGCLPSTDMLPSSDSVPASSTELISKKSFDSGTGFGTLG